MQARPSILNASCALTHHVWVEMTSGGRVGAPYCESSSWSQLSNRGFLGPLVEHGCQLVFDTHIWRWCNRPGCVSQIPIFVLCSLLFFWVTCVHAGPFTLQIDGGISAYKAPRPAVVAISSAGGSNLLTELHRNTTGLGPRPATIKPLWHFCCTLQLRH